MDERAGQSATAGDLVDVPGLVTAYFSDHPDPAEPSQQVAFGTSGHRGSARRLSFNEDHIIATSQAICEYRAEAGITGPIFIGRDTHALSEPAMATALEVLAASGAPTQSSPITAAPAPAWQTGSSSPRRTTRPPTAASSTTPRMAARPAPTSRRHPAARPTAS
jgi:phosphoglucomutase